MPGKVKVRVVAGRGLPVMDRSADTTDAFAEVKLGDTTYKTEVFRKSLNPAWNSEWYRFELDDMELQDEPLQVRIMDYDTYSANDAIGKVYIDLNPLLLPQPGSRPIPGTDVSISSSVKVGPITSQAVVKDSLKGGAVLSGWLPVYDTLQGIRGEVNLIVKVELFSDLNKFRQSSCGVQFFCCPGVPEGYRAQFLPGFVEELVVSDDPEYKWIDKIRTPRASNEARQLLFNRLSGEVRRKIGLKALELGGNAVTGYRQCFDLEGETGIVVRGIGTAVTLTRLLEEPSPGPAPPSSSPRGSRESSAGKDMRPQSLGPLPPPPPGPVSGPALRLIPATPVVGEEHSVGSSPRKKVMAIQEDSVTDHVSMKDASVNNSPRTMKTPLVSRSNTQTSDNSESVKASMSACSDCRNENEWVRSPSVRSVGGWKPRTTSGLRRSNSDKTPSKKKSVKVIRKMKSVNKTESVKSAEVSLKGSSSYQKSSKSSRKSSFYRVIDKLRFGFRRRSSVQAPGQADFLDSISKMSDSRIVENWLLSLDEDAAAPVEVVEVPDKLLRVSESSSTCREGLTPTNELVEQDRKANGSEPERVLFQFAASSEDEESVGGGEVHLRCRPSSAPPRPPAFLRQMSECSEYTTDTHDTGETAQVTAKNTLTNMKASFTCEGDEIRKGKGTQMQVHGQHHKSEHPSKPEVDLGSSLKPVCSYSEDEELDDLEVATINLESIGLELGGGQLTSRSSEATMYTGGSSQRSQPVDTAKKSRSRRAGSYGSDCQANTLDSPRLPPELWGSGSRDGFDQPDYHPDNGPADMDSDTPPRGLSAGSSGSEKLLAHKTTRPAGGEGIPEFPFLTLTRLPPGFLVHLGGMVSAKSVKLLDEQELKDSDAREAWWVEIRQEVRSHAKALGCNMVVGYQENTVICEDVLIMSSSGTAAVCNLDFMSELESGGGGGGGRSSFSKESVLNCGVCHIPYSEASVPFPIKLVKCGLCGRGKVADILISTLEPPPELEVLGEGGLIQARVLRLKKDLKGEHDAREVSDALPFLEYEIHRQLVNKLKVKGMNAIFGLTVSLSLADRMLVGLASGTAVCLPALPSPALPRVLDTGLRANRDQQHAGKLQERLREKVEANKEYFGLKRDTEAVMDDGEVWEEQQGLAELDLSAGNKDTCVLEVDDIEDTDIVDSLLDNLPPKGVQVLSCQTPVGVDSSRGITACQAFAQVWRGRLEKPTSREFSTASQQLVSAVCFKLRRLQPCLLSSLSWQVSLDDDEVQLNLSGVAIAFDDQQEVVQKKEDGEVKEGELVFRLEEVQSTTDAAGSSVCPKLKLGRNPPFFFAAPTALPHIGVNLTPTPYVPGARIDHHLGNLNLFYIRETSGLREAGGLNSFVQRFLCEVLGILRAQVAALGGNAVTSYTLATCVLTHSPHKNQAQCLVNVGGDVVSAVYVHRQA